VSYTISDCGTLESQELCSAMNAAFSDYVVPMKLSLAQFEAFQRQRGYAAETSFVALDGDDIAAFWLSARPNPEFGHRAYTLSVGTHPEHRRQGLSRRLLDAVLKVQRENGAAGLQLEVITSNRPAIDTYEAAGFYRHRTLRVMKLEIEPGASGRSITPQPIDLGELPEKDDTFFEAAPTPQNSRTALGALSPDVRLLGVKKDGLLLGWGAVYPDGAVAQIAVNEAARRRGIGSALLRGLWQAAGQQSLTFVNVDASAASLNAFLDKAGAEELLQQYEMRFDLT